MTTVPGAQGQVPEMQEETGYAASTMVTDGRHACAIFPNGNIGAFDYDGERIWAKNLGAPQSSYGYASSLAIFRNLVIVQYDQASEEDELSALIAIDIATGTTVWQTKRPVPNSWTSPVVAKVGDSYQVFTSADPFVLAYDPNNGSELWRFEITATDSAPSPIYSTGHVFAVEPYSALIAIKLDPNNVKTAPQVAWTADDDVPDISSPLCDGSRVYTLTAGGHLICYALADGKLLWEHEFDGDFSASPAMAGGNIYLPGELGAMHVIAAADEYREIAISRMDDKFRASPAFADGRIFLRGQNHLYCIGKSD
jgi:outer membrane protein assembly factor BamB